MLLLPDRAKSQVYLQRAYFPTLWCLDGELLPQLGLTLPGRIALIFLYSTSVVELLGTLPNVFIDTQPLRTLPFLILVRWVAFVRRSYCCSCQVFSGGFLTCGGVKLLRLG